MKKLLTIVCAAAVLGGCATRPQDGPGSGSGAYYVPRVESTAAFDSAVYEADLAKCRSSAQNLPFNASQHDGALVVVDTTAVGTGIMAGIPAAAGAVLVGTLVGFQYWVYTPERRAWNAKQETVMLNCLAQRGYVNTDPSVRVTWVPPSQRPSEALRATGVDTYNAEKLAKTQRCAVMPLATLVEKGPGFERHAVPCSNGQVLAIRCEFGNCRGSQVVASLVRN